jgi:hypothetical protein
MRLLTAILILMGLAVASGEGEDDVQLILGDEEIETLDCADDLQLAIEDVFDDVEVVQTVDLEATDEDFEIDPAFNVIVYLDEDIINGNCTAIIEDVLDIIDVPQVQVITRGDHSYYYKSGSKSRSKHRCPYYKKRGFRGYHKKWWTSSSRDDSEDRKKRWWMKKKQYGWKKRKFLRWWDSSDSDDGHWKNWKRSRGSWKRSKGTDTSKNGPSKKESEPSSSSEDPPLKKKQESVESERSRQPKPKNDSPPSERSPKKPPKVKVVRKSPQKPKRKPSSPPKREPKPKPEPKKSAPKPKKNLRASHKKRGRSEEEEEFN